MGNPLVSIIVPVYNGEKTIERCLRSIQNQSYKNIEVIVVNDGSIDHTERILKKYEENDSRFHIINQPNAGVSRSRNVGIAMARGEFLQFVDGDDWIVKHATDTYVDMAVGHSCDMVISDYYRVKGKQIYVNNTIKRNGKITRNEFAEYMMEAPSNFYYGVLWNKFFRTEIVRKQDLTCSEDLDWCEDFKFNLEYLQYVNNIVLVKEPLYYYVKTKGSLVDTQVNIPQIIKTKRILFNYYKELYKSLDLYEENKLKIQLFYLSFAHDKGKKKKLA